MKKIYNLLICTYLVFPFTNINLLAQVSWGDPNAVPVEFRFNHELAQTDSGVGLNGSFNGWLGGVFPMQEYEPDWWKTTLDLLPIGYEYKFVTYTDTAGQAGVTGYFTDPLNPISGGPFNNSIITIKDPMIYYFLPKNGVTLYVDRPDISANIAVANGSQLDISRIKFKFDNVEITNASQYYNSQTKMFKYTPPGGLPFTTHSAYLKVFNTDGDSAELTTTFTLASFFSAGPYTFLFDSRSPNFDFPNPITRVDAKGTFNNWGSTPMNDPDSNGIFELTRNLHVNTEQEYTIVVNSGLYINDPDNPNLSNNYRTYSIKRLQNYPYFTKFNTSNGKVFTQPAGNLLFSATISRNDSIVNIDSLSLGAKLNGATVPVNIVPGTGGTYEIQVNINNPPAGRYVIEFYGADIHGNQAEPVYFVFGVKAVNSGFHFVDGEFDDKGPDSYLYPSGIDPGSADISEINITAVPTLDSLKFTITMKGFSVYSRVGFYITNLLNGEYVDAPDNVAIQIPEWNNRGVYFTIAPRNSSFFNPLTENIVYTSREPMITSYSFSIDSSQINSGKISFIIPLNLLESVMGTYRNDWYMGAYSYFKDQNGTIKIDENLGGFDFQESPNIFDATFFSNNKIQERIINNFISSSGIGGPRIAKTGSPERGSFRVSASEIDTILANIPEIKIFASGGKLFSDTVRVTGFADANPGTSITLEVNQTDTTLILDGNQRFSAVVSLVEGDNHITASMNFIRGFISRSPAIIYTRIVNHTPKAKIYSSVTGSDVTMYADSSYDPDGGVLAFIWEQDSANPAQVSLSGSTSTTASFTAPGINGDYYFTLKAVGSGNRTGWARTVFVVSDSNVYNPDYTTWHPMWVDTQIVYSVFVRTFSPEGSFNKVTEELPALKELGINTIWFLPVHPTTNNIGPDNPGYAITDYYDVTSNYGTANDFRNLVNTAHSYGIKIIMDHVIQHTSVLHPFMKDANVYKQYSPYYPFYMWDVNNNFQYLFTWVDLPSINYEEESTRKYLLDMAEYWVHDFNVDGFRCDVAWAINDIRPSGPAYWRNFRRNLKSVKPDIFLLAEADARFERYFDQKFDAAYDWNWLTQLKAIFSGSGSIDSLNSSMEYFYNPAFPQHARPFKFLENQDEQRFIEAYGVAATKMAAALLFSSPGVPMLYAGQEVGEYTFRGIINWNDPDNLRPFYKKMVSLRYNNDALNSGDYTQINNSNPNTVLSFLRTKDENNVISVFNFGTSQVTTTINVPIELLAFDSTETFYLNDFVNDDAFLVTGSQLRNYPVTLPGTTARVFVLSYDQLVNINNDEVIIPKEYSIAQNYPNPFNPSTRIRYTLPFNSHVKISVFNILGEKIADLIAGEMNAGVHETLFNASRYASGVYFYTIEAKSLSGKETFRNVKKMILLR